MGKIKPPKKVLPIAGIIFIDGFYVADVIKGIEPDVGRVLMKSEIIPFIHTTYYNKEMGNKLLRQWWLFEKLMTPDCLVELKLKTDETEKRYLNEKGGRQINIDPGILSLNNLILASTKNYSHRIYLGKGIYGEVSLIYQDKTFNPLGWTYPDYREATALKFFNRAREILREKNV
jgi:hypothetical protein